MLSRFTANGTTQDDKQVLLAYELNEVEFKLTLHIVPNLLLSNEQREFLQNEWEKGDAFEFPEGTEIVNPSLNDESILPDNIRSEETGKIRIKANEWAYQLLTAKLWESYLLELEQLKERANNLSSYDRQLFDDAKSFWERVLEHRKERDISQERLDKIKDEVNSIFEKLKTFRKVESAEFESASAKLREAVIAQLEEVKSRADENANFKALADELKNIQNESRKNRYSKADEMNLRKAFDAAFQYINDKRNLFFSDKNATRIKGLNEVIQKMEKSLQRDLSDLAYLDKKTNSPNIKSLELQLIQVKKNLLNESIASKQEKLKDIRSTLEKLQRQVNKVSKQQHTTAPAEAGTTEAAGETPVVLPVEDNSSAKATSSPTE